MDIFDILKSILFGVVEGITEWLPISSTGHLILIEEFVKFQSIDDPDRFMEMFDVVIQLGAILAVIAVYFEKLNPFSGKKTKEEVKDTYMLWAKVIVSCIPAGVIGLLVNDYIDGIFYNMQTVACTLIIYGAAFIVIEMGNSVKNPKVTELSKLTFKTAFMIGLFQVLALIPGTSRSGATIIGGMLLGASRFVAAEFTFFLAIPVMFGASFLKLIKYGFNYSANEAAVLIVGMLVSFGVSVAAIKTFIGYIKQKDFSVFGIYRIVLGVILLIYIILPHLMK